MLNNNWRASLFLGVTVAFSFNFEVGHHLSLLVWDLDSTEETGWRWKGGGKRQLTITLSLSSSFGSTTIENNQDAKQRKRWNDGSDQRPENELFNSNVKKKHNSSERRVDLVRKKKKSLPPFHVKGLFFKQSTSTGWSMHISFRDYGWSWGSIPPAPHHMRWLTDNRSCFQIHSFSAAAAPSTLIRMTGRGTTGGLDGSFITDQHLRTIDVSIAQRPSPSRLLRWKNKTTTWRRDSDRGL